MVSKKELAVLCRMRENASRCYTCEECGRGTKSSRVGEVLAIATFYDPIVVHMNGTTATESIYKLEKPMRRWSNGRGITLVHACGHRRLGILGGRAVD